MLGHELLGDMDVLVRDGAGSSWGRLVMAARFLEVLAVERAADRNFALRAATERADVSPDTGAETPRAAGFANRAGHSLSIEVR